MLSISLNVILITQLVVSAAPSGVWHGLPKKRNSRNPRNPRNAVTVTKSTV